MRKLTDDEFKATVAPEKKRVGLDENPPFDFWPYFDAIPPDDFGGHDFSDGSVSYSWTMIGTAYQHVLVSSETPDVVLALVLDVPSRSVVGHYLLDLNQLYGLS